MGGLDETQNIGLPVGVETVFGTPCPAGIQPPTHRVHAGMTPRIVAAALAAGLVLAACGSNPPAPVGDDGAEITLPEPADGPIPDVPVTPDAAAASPLPEVTVRQINGDGGFVQLKNELPSDKPLLVWFWAPH